MMIKANPAEGTDAAWGFFDAVYAKFESAKWHDDFATRASPVFCRNSFGARRVAKPHQCDEAFHNGEAVRAARKPSLALLSRM